MAKHSGLGNFINGSFLNEGTITLTSKNPSCNYEPVLSVQTDPGHIPIAIKSAQIAYKSWSYLSQDQRNSALIRLKEAFQKNEDAMASAISAEMGKIKSEALTEAKSLSARIDLMINHGLKRVQTEAFYDLRAETRYHSQGVLAVVGPYNFPAHLVNAHVIPSVLLGNTVVIKPSEVCPQVAQVYAHAVMEANLPHGVINIVHGDGVIGKALCQHPDISGVLFTGSYRTGRALQEALLDQPHKILALEMGGKNFSVVMDDADLGQALLEIIQAAFLTTGQRCTATSRVLVHERVYETFRSMLVKAIRQIKPCMPHENGLFGPLATKHALQNFLNGLASAKSEGAEVLVESEVLQNGAFVTPSLYQVTNKHPLKHYLFEELFGPNIALESFAHFDDAILRINESPYGLSNAIFTFDSKNSERMIHETKSGVFNINRSTNNAFGQMPFGGLNRSGNQRPAGIDAVRYATFPIAVSELAVGGSSASTALKNQFRDLIHDETPLSLVIKRHELESVFELYGIYSDSASHQWLRFSRSSFDGLGARTETFFTELQTLFGPAIDLDASRFVVDLARVDAHTIKSLADLLQRTIASCGLSLRKHRASRINVPKDLAIPRSRAMLDRLYRGQFFPAEKKLLVPDLKRSRGPLLASIDDDPLVLFDAASQIATLGAGFFADTFQNAYDNHEFDLALMRNCDLALPEQNEKCATYQDALQARTDFEAFLLDQSHHMLPHFAYGASGAEANEIALDLARLNGLGGTRIIAFEGSFHGRTIMTLQATYNKEKRGPFVFEGYQATFLPFPELKDPTHNPSAPKEFLATLSRGDIPCAEGVDPLLAEEIASLAALKHEYLQGNICAVIIEPMQCEGGDRYASDRFFSGLRALTRALSIPLIFDEVQTGFHLGRQFFWYQQINLVDQHGAREIPDCVTMAKKAQLGVCMSVWPSPRAYSPHVIQLKRGLLHGQTLVQKDVLPVEQKALAELKRLCTYFPDLVQNPRANGFAFAFDMPNKALANELVDLRFHRGFMVYIAGERTLRFRLNTTTSDDIINQLFEKLFLALMEIRDRQTITLTPKPIADAPKSEPGAIRFIELNPDIFAQHVDDIAHIEQATYEPGRRDSMDDLLAWLKVKDGVGLLMMCTVDNKEALVGYAFGGPLEHAKPDGARHDPHRGKNDTFYSANITVEDRTRGLGFGSLLKHEQIHRVHKLRNVDGSPRYLYMSGRNRLDKTVAMSKINDNLGAYFVSLHDNQYSEQGAKAVYYRLPIALRTHPVEKPNPNSLDCQNSLQRIFKLPPDSLVNAVATNQLRAIVGTKLTLSNWATPHLIRYSELLRSVMPKHLRHAYFTSGRDEIVDKGLRCLRYHRADADIAIGFSHQWFGATSATARSLSHAEKQAQPFSFFNWPKIAHPSLVGTQASLNELQLFLNQTPADRILGIVIELVGERSGFSFSDDYLAELDAIRARTGIPLVFVESTSSFNRTGRGLFLSDSLNVKANMVLWYTGGQLGHVLVDDNYYTDKPLTLISTWDGDELSIARAYHHMMASMNISGDAFKQFETALRGAADRWETHGIGGWHALRFKDERRLAQALKLAREQRVYFGQGFDSSLMVCPKLDFSAADFAHVIDVVKQIGKSVG